MQINGYRQEGRRVSQEIDNTVSESCVHSPCTGTCLILSNSAMSCCGSISAASESGTCVHHIEKSFLPIVHHSRSHLVFSRYAGSYFSRAVGSVVEIITCTEKQGSK